MVTAPKKLVVVFALIAWALLATACNSAFPPLLVASDGEGALTVALHGVRVTTAEGSMVNVRLQMAKRQFEVVQELPVADMQEGVTFDNIAHGEWAITASIIETDPEEADGTHTTHVGSGTVLVGGGHTTTTIELDPAPGELRIAIDMGEQCIDVGGGIDCLQDHDLTGRYLLKPQIQENARGNFDWPEEEVLTRADMPPGSYEYQLTFHYGNRTTAPVLQSEWHPVDILPGRVTEVQWSPLVGALNVGIVVRTLPLPPRDVRFEEDGTGSLTLVWTPPADAVTGYIVYARGAPQEWFCQVDTGATTAASWSVPADHAVQCVDGSDFTAADYTVTARNAAGYESLRGDVVAAPARSASYSGSKK